MIITCHFLLYTNFRNRLVDNVLCTALVALCTVIWRHKVNKLYTYWKFIAVKYMIILKEVETVMVNNSGWVRLEVATDFLLLNQIHTFVGGEYIIYRFRKFCINDNLLFSLIIFSVFHIFAQKYQPRDRV